MNLDDKKLGLKFMLISAVLFPVCSSFYIVSIFSNNLIKDWLSYILLFISVLSFLMFFLGIYMYRNSDKKLGLKIKKPIKYAIIFLLLIYAVGGYTVVGLLYLSSGFKDWLVTSAMTSMSHKYYATWFYDDYEINTVMANNDVIETGEDTNVNLVDFKELNFNKVTYANKFEEEIFTKEEGNDIYKIIDIDRKGNSASRIVGKLAVIYDPSMVTLGLSKGIGTDVEKNYGQFVYEITKRNNAVIGINAGGFIDPNWNSTGGVPSGLVISDGKLIANNRSVRNHQKLVGFNKDNKLILARMGYEEAKKAGIRDAVHWGPFLIVNGNKSFVKGNGGWGTANRTAIGQRKDGIVLLLVMDGRSSITKGADMVDLTNIMADYGAINAANMDGGTSSSMVLNNEIITNPRNGAFQNKTRPVPTAWIVKSVK